MSIAGKEAKTGFDLKLVAKILKIFHHLYILSITAAINILKIFHDNSQQN